MKYCIPGTLATLAFLCATTAFADAPTVERVSTDNRGTNWTFAVTLSHPETGWDHYADGWEVLAPDGTSLGIRVLAHPHVNEQPFTRSLGSVDIPADTPYVTIRARDNVDGWFEAEYRVELGE